MSTSDSLKVKVTSMLMWRTRDTSKELSDVIRVGNDCCT